MLSKIVQESALDEFFHELEYIDYCIGLWQLGTTEEQKSRKKILKENIIKRTQISLLEAELERKKGMMKKEHKDWITKLTDEENGYNKAIQEDITYLQEQIEEIKKLIK